MQKMYYLNKDLILGAICSQGKTVSGFCADIGVNRCNFYQYLSRAYLRPRSRVFSKVAKELGLSESLIWTTE